jgi:hypothetical protein
MVMRGLLMTSDIIVVKIVLHDCNFVGYILKSDIVLGVYC